MVSGDDDGIIEPDGDTEGDDKLYVRRNLHLPLPPLIHLPEGRR